MSPQTRAAAAKIAGFPDTVPTADNGGLHKRRVLSSTKQHGNAASSSGQRNAENCADVPPIYTIDLSRPPAERYVELALDFKDEVNALIELFDDVVEDLVPGISITTIKRLAKILLRRVYSSEQTEELRGISRAVGVEMYLLIAFNTLLDLLMGCTSGGVKVSVGKDVKMMHFRTLDWGMDVLRRVVVQLEYVQRPKGRVIARSVTYVGFVGILTGLRKDLSLSLNFRPNHNNATSRWANFLYYFNHLAVLLGLRPSIASTLRGFILPSSKQQDRSYLSSLANIISLFPSKTSTACYIIASDGQETTIFEKDLKTAVIHTSKSFITTTNHDFGCENNNSHPNHSSKVQPVTGMEEAIAESIDRKQCIEEEWKKAAKKYIRKNAGASQEDVSVNVEDVQRWMLSYPMANEATHYAVIMDPMAGDVVWVRRWLEPIETGHEQRGLK